MSLNNPFIKKMNLVLLIPSLVLLLNIDSVIAKDFGRFMTTAKERKHLDDLRDAKTELVVDIDETELELDDDAESEEVPLGTITAKGLVYSNKGESTAWINNSNSYEGDVASNYVSITREDIQPDRVNIKLLGYENKVQLKVGQTFEPETEQLKDIMDNESASSSDFKQIPVNK